MLAQLINFLITPAHADVLGGAAPVAGTQNGSFSFMIMFLVFIVFIYFAIWRPQSKRAKEQQNLLNSLAKGDEVVTAGGLIGRVTKIADNYISVSVANNVDIVMQKSAVSSVLPKGTLKTLE